MIGFHVIRRNPGHWDITGEAGRLFRIRGGPGAYTVSDERDGHDSGWRPFKTLDAAMAFICSDLMFELIVAEGQQPTTIEGWNVPRADVHAALRAELEETREALQALRKAIATVHNNSGSWAAVHAAEAIISRAEKEGQ